MLSFQTSSARQSSLIAEAILHLGHRSESGSAMKCGRGRNGAPGRIRTCTVLLLREPPPAGWATGASLDNERREPCQRVHLAWCDENVFAAMKQNLSPHHGIEPGTSCLQGRRSHQLSYAGMSEITDQTVGDSARTDH